MDEERYAQQTAAAARSRARRGLVIYLAVVVVLSGVVQGTIMHRGGPIGDHMVLVLCLMWSPTVAMVVARLVNREGFRDVSFRLGMRHGGARMYLLAWLFPVVVGSIAYGAAWALSLVPIGVPKGLREGLGADVSIGLAFVTSLGLTMTLGVLLSAITAAGEEFGWRGYMLMRLMDAGVPRPLLVGGAFWGLWHAPLILSGQYAVGPSPVLSTALFMVSITAAGYLAARMRLQSGSVWPAVMFHSAWNSIIQGTFDGFVPGHDASHAGNVWVGESGVLVVAVTTGLALSLVWRPFPLRREPSDSTAARAGLRTL